MNFLVILFSLLILNASCSHHHSHHRFNDVQKWEKRFEDPKRDSWQRPNKIISTLGISKSMIVADIGGSTGYFPIKIAKKAKRVWSIDIEPNLINYLNNRAENENLKNLFSILGTENDPLIPEKVDYILMVNTYHHISKRITYFSALKSKLKKDGKLVIIDFKKKNLPIGPKIDMKLSFSEIEDELKKAGLKLIKRYDFLEFQNMLVFANDA